MKGIVNFLFKVGFNKVKRGEMTKKEYMLLVRDAHDRGLLSDKQTFELAKKTFLYVA